MGWMSVFLLLKAFACQSRKIPYIPTHCTFGIRLPDFVVPSAALYLTGDLRRSVLLYGIRTSSTLYVHFFFCHWKTTKMAHNGLRVPFRARKTIFVMPNVHSTIMQTSIIHSHLDKTNVIMNSKPNNTAMWLE